MQSCNQYNCDEVLTRNFTQIFQTKGYLAVTEAIIVNETNM